MRCVYFGDTLPNSFEEQVQFSEEMPYRINIKRFQAEDIVPLHYADSIEILLCEDLCGEIVIDANRYPLGGRQMFVIPPYTIHSNSIRICDGTMYVFKIGFREMDRYIHVENYCGSAAAGWISSCIRTPPTRRFFKSSSISSGTTAP